MLEPRKKPPIEELKLIGPADLIQQVAEYASGLGLSDVTDSVPWREAFPEYTEEQLPGGILAGARHKEDMTQRELARKSGIPQRHISEMENGKRSIGKANARKLAEILDVDYRIFL